jgi:plasmid stabilization system protein ParE
MAFAIIVAARARRELHDASDWWRANRPEAQSRLDEEVLRALDLLAANPYIGTKMRTRRRSIRRFPLVSIGYWIAYEARVPTQQVVVVAFWNGSRGRAPSVVR